MKSSLACPKCESRKLWRVERFAAESHSGHSRDLRVAVMRKTRWDTAYTTGHVDAYICVQCGYTELWSHGFDRLEHNPKDGVHFIDTTPQQGQYR